MIIFQSITLLLAGFILLIKGADFFVDGSSAVAKRLKVPSLIIGLTIVAMGTSLPELSVSITASMANSNALAVSNVIGSNIFNLMVVLGASVMMSSIDVDDGVIKKDFPFTITCAALLLIFGCCGMALGRADGLILLTVFAIFLLCKVMSALSARKAALAEAGNDEDDGVSLWRAIAYIVAGAVAVRFGGDWVVSGAKNLAAFCGLSENLIGLTIVATGTSLPELVTSVVAARKHELDMAVGNVIGSNVFNILMILGAASTLSPVAFNAENVMDIGALIAFSLLVWGFCVVERGLTNRMDYSCLPYIAFM